MHGAVGVVVVGARDADAVPGRELDRIDGVEALVIEVVGRVVQRLGRGRSEPLDLDVRSAGGTR
jgi:hypothetical protein